MDRMALLNEILSQNPADPFARYGLAMEYSNASDVERALDEFKKLLATNLTTRPATLWLHRLSLERDGQMKKRRCWSMESLQLNAQAMPTQNLRWKQCSLTWDSSLRPVRRSYHSPFH